MYVRKLSNLGGNGIFAVENIKKHTIIIREKHLAIHNQRYYEDENLNEFFKKNFKSPDLWFCQELKNRKIKEERSEIYLLNEIIKNLTTINKDYGKEWYFSLHSNDVPLSNQDNLIFSILGAKYNPDQGIDLIKKLFFIISNNSFSSLTFNCLDFEASKINHSCDNNCNILNFPNYTVILSNRNIKQGEEITINYGDQWFRKRHIKCKCGKCEIDKEINNDYLFILKFNSIHDFKIDTHDLDTRLLDWRSAEKRKEFYLMCLCFGGLEMLHYLLIQIDKEQNHCFNILRLPYIGKIIFELAELYNLEPKEFLLFLMLISTDYYYLYIDNMFEKFLDIKTINEFIKIMFSSSIEFDVKKDINKINMFI